MTIGMQRTGPDGNGSATTFLTLSFLLKIHGPDGRAFFRRQVRKNRRYNAPPDTRDQMQKQSSDDPRLLLLSHRCSRGSILRGLNAIAKKCDHAKQELTGMYGEQTVRWMHEQERLFFSCLSFPDRTSNRKPPASLLLLLPV